MIIQVTDETSLEAVARRTLPASTSEQTVSQTISAIHAANPGLNLGSITPGMLLIVPNTATTTTNAARTILSRVEPALAAPIRELATTASQTDSPALTAVIGRWIAEVNTFTTGQQRGATELATEPNPLPEAITQTTISMTWVDNDLTALGPAQPAAAGTGLSAYTPGDGGQHVNFVDAGGHVHELYRNPDPQAQWVDNDLSTPTVAVDTAVVSAVDGYAEADGSQHVNFIDAGGHVHELYRSAGAETQWVDNDLTKLAGGTPANATAGSVLGGYALPDGGQNINFIGTGGHVHELYRNPGAEAQWVDSDLTDLAHAQPAGAGTGLAAYTQGDGIRHVNFVDAFGHVHELYRSPGAEAQWVDNDLTKLAGGTTVGPSAVDGYVEADGSQHVNYVDAGGHVHELYRGPGAEAQWVDNDLTRLAGGTPANAAAGSVLVGYALPDGGQTINFIDAGGHVHELYRNPGAEAQWVDADLTNLAAGVPANLLALAGYTQGDGIRHVNFVDASGHVHELYGSPGG